MPTNQVSRDSDGVLLRLSYDQVLWLSEAIGAAFAWAHNAVNVSDAEKRARLDAYATLGELLDTAKGMAHADAGSDFIGGPQDVGSSDPSRD